MESLFGKGRNTEVAAASPLRDARCRQSQELSSATSPLPSRSTTGLSESVRSTTVECSTGSSPESSTIAISCRQFDINLFRIGQQLAVAAGHAGGQNRPSELLQQRAAHRMIRHANSHRLLFGQQHLRHFAAGRQNKGERSGQTALHDLIGGRVHVRVVRNVRQVRAQKRQRVILGIALQSSAPSPSPAC